MMVAFGGPSIAIKIDNRKGNVHYLIGHIIYIKPHVPMPVMQITTHKECRLVEEKKILHKYPLPQVKLHGIKDSLFFL